MSLWRKKLELHSNLAGVPNGQMQNPIDLLPPPTNFASILQEKFVVAGLNADDCFLFFWANELESCVKRCSG
nr:hypothetical protein CRG98_030154 [Ipomoea batatas]